MGYILPGCYFAMAQNRASGMSDRNSIGIKRDGRLGDFGAAMIDIAEPAMR
jgi:hypothetical protein